MVSLGISLTPSKEIQEYVNIARLAEKAGIKHIWVPDEVPSYPYRDPFVTLTALALNTKKAKLGTSVTNPYTRHVSHIAAAMLTIDEISDGRSIIGLGPGGSLTLQPLGFKMWDRPILAVKEAVKVLRRLLEGKIVDYDGPFMKAIRIQMFRKSPIPIYVAARGKEMLALAGQIADGVLMTSPLRLLPHHIRIVKENAEKAGRDISKIDIVNGGRFSISMDEEAALDAAKSSCAFMITNLPDSWLAAVNVTKNDHEALKTALFKGGIKEARNLVTNDMVRSIAIAGNPTVCVKKIRAMIKTGVTQVNFGSPLGPDLKEAFELIRNEVIPKLR